MLDVAPADRLIVALDVPRVADAVSLVETLAPSVRVFKIGYWLLFEPDLDRLIDLKSSRGVQFFLDAKLHDIPETVRQGVRSAAQRGFDFITVHADHEALLEAAMVGKADSAIKVMAITALSSLPLAASRERFRAGLLNAVRAGCDGLIMAPADLADHLVPGLTIRSLVGNRLIATPGIRWAGELVHDHARAGTPAMAIAHGADYIIVGRAIVNALDPLSQVERFIEQITNAVGPAEATEPPVARV